MTPRKKKSPRKKTKQGDAVDSPQKNKRKEAKADVDRAVLLWEFCILHGHVDVPHSCKPDRRVARFVHCNKGQRKTLQAIWEDKHEAPDWLKFSSAAQTLRGITLTLFRHPKMKMKMKRTRDCRSSSCG